MKRTILFFGVVTILNVNSYIIKVPTVLPNDKPVPITIGRITIQKLLTPLFEDVCEESTEPNILRLSEEFELNPKTGDYINPEVIDNFLNLWYNKGLLAKGEIFTEYNKDHMIELKTIYDVLVNAENFGTFYKAACWARQNVNCGIFVDAIYMAIIRRRDTEKVLLPAIYEVLPNYFIRKDYIIKASSLLSGADSSMDEYIRDDGNSYILDVNYTDNYFDNNIEQMSYFYEDVDLNTYYFFMKLKMLKWSTNEISDIRNQRGQYIYHAMKQLNTRYNLERYSNGIPEVEAIDWNIKDECVYDPLLIYSNGQVFNKRSLLGSQNDNLIVSMKNLENSIPSAVTDMRDAGYNKSEIFNYLMDILVTGEVSYENLAMQLLSNYNSNTGTTSVLGHYMTTLRDPIFWRVNKRILDIVDNAIKVLPAYDITQLYFPGVEVLKLDVKKPITSCDKYEFDVTDALRNKEVESRFQIKFNQNRLNSKPFSVKISILSLVMEKALIKLYIGPKVLPGQSTDRKKMFMQLDSFEVNLKIGSNTITRTSNEMSNLSDEFISLKAIRKYIQDADFGIDALPLRTIDSQTGFPSRLILPKGTNTPFQIFVFVAPYVKAIVGGTRNLQTNNDAILSPGYPLDLDIEIQDLFDLPNSLVKDITITHKSFAAVPLISDTNNYYNWQNNNTEFSNTPTHLVGAYPKPSYTSKKFDYKSKKDKYEKKQDEIETPKFENDNAGLITVNKNMNTYGTQDEQVEGKTASSDTVILNIERKEEGDNTDKFETKNDYKEVITIDKNINDNNSKDKLNEKENTRSENIIIKTIESKGGEYGTKGGEIETETVKSDYGKVITVDKLINDNYSRDKLNEKENTLSENVIIKTIESKGGEYRKKGGEIETNIVKSGFGNVITDDKNINKTDPHDKLDEKENNEKDNDSDKASILKQPTKKMYNLWWNYQPL